MSFSKKPKDRLRVEVYRGGDELTGKQPSQRVDQ